MPNYSLNKLPLNSPTPIPSQQPDTNNLAENISKPLIIKIIIKSHSRPFKMHTQSTRQKIYKLLTQSHQQKEAKLRKQKAVPDLYMIIQGIIRRKLSRGLEDMKSYNFNNNRKQFIQANIDAGFRVQGDENSVNVSRKRRSKTVDAYAEYSRRKLLDEIIRKLKLKNQLREDLSQSSDTELYVRITNLQRIIHEFYIENSFDRSRVSEMSNTSLNGTKLTELTQQLAHIKQQLEERSKKNNTNQTFDSSRNYQETQYPQNHGNQHSTSIYGLPIIPSPLVKPNQYIPPSPSPSPSPRPLPLPQYHIPQQNQPINNRIHQGCRPSSSLNNYNDYHKVKPYNYGPSMENNNTKNRQQYYGNTVFNNNHNTKPQINYPITTVIPPQHYSHNSHYVPNNYSGGRQPQKPIFTHQTQQIRPKGSNINKTQVRHHPIISRNNIEIPVTQHSRNIFTSLDQQRISQHKPGYARINILSPRPYTLKKQSSNSREPYKKSQFRKNQ